MIKWIKNKYYLTQNEWYLYCIHDAQKMFKNREITASYYRSLLLKYKSKIMANLGKVIL